MGHFVECRGSYWVGIGGSKFFLSIKMKINTVQKIAFSNLFTKPSYYKRKKIPKAITSTLQKVQGQCQPYSILNLAPMLLCFYL